MDGPRALHAEILDDSEVIVPRRRHRGRRPFLPAVLVATGVIAIAGTAIVGGWLKGDRARTYPGGRGASPSSAIAAVTPSPTPLVTRLPTPVPTPPAWVRNGLGDALIPPSALHETLLPPDAQPFDLVDGFLYYGDRTGLWRIDTLGRGGAPFLIESPSKSCNQFSEAQAQDGWVISVEVSARCEGAALANAWEVKLFHLRDSKVRVLASGKSEVQWPEGGPHVAMSGGTYVTTVPVPDTLRQIVEAHDTETGKLQWRVDGPAFIRSLTVSGGALVIDATDVFATGPTAQTTVGYTFGDPAFVALLSTQASAARHAAMAAWPAMEPDLGCSRISVGLLLPTETQPLASYGTGSEPQPLECLVGVGGTPDAPVVAWSGAKGDKALPYVTIASSFFGGRLVAIPDVSYATYLAVDGSVVGVVDVGNPSGIRVLAVDLAAVRLR